jgi:glycosyltransferase involved in cell wall biosynthesis
MAASKHPNLVFLGEVKDAYEFMRSKAIMIVPLLSGSGMRIKIVEGMALGKSIVTTGIGTEGIATTSGENIMVADSPEEFADAICRLAEDIEYFDRIGQNAFKFVGDNYDNLAITASLVEFFQTL